MNTYILGIESSCDDTSAAVLKNNNILANIVANQKVHQNFGGVVPELASRAHQQNIIPVVDMALKNAGISKSDLHAIAVTSGPGLLGSLLVGISFAKSMALALGIPIIGVDHMQAHILAHFIREENDSRALPAFPFLCLTISGGHTQIVLVRDYLDMEVIGKTIDDAAGEAFDKAARIMGLPYPGGPVIDQLAENGDPMRFKFAKPVIPGLDYSFSGLKTSFLYFVRDHLKANPKFIQENRADLCASMQHTIIAILMEKLVKASGQYQVTDIAIAGGVSANSEMRKTLEKTGREKKWRVFIPEFEYTTDNAGMIAIAGYFRFLKGQISGMDITPYARGNY
jgi:N6-L-threonylcarbamoyladenine synthase